MKITILSAITALSLVTAAGATELAPPTSPDQYNAAACLRTRPGYSHISYTPGANVDIGRIQLGCAQFLSTTTVVHRRAQNRT